MKTFAEWLAESAESFAARIKDSMEAQGAYDRVYRLVQPHLADLTDDDYVYLHPSNYSMSPEFQLKQNLSFKALAPLIEDIEAEGYIFEITEDRPEYRYRLFHFKAGRDDLKPEYLTLKVQIHEHTKNCRVEEVDLGEEIIPAQPERVVKKTKKVIVCEESDEAEPLCEHGIPAAVCTHPDHDSEAPF